MDQKAPAVDSQLEPGQLGICCSPERTGTSEGRVQQLRLAATQHTAHSTLSTLDARRGDCVLLWHALSADITANPRRVVRGAWSGGATPPTVPVRSCH